MQVGRYGRAKDLRGLIQCQAKGARLRYWPRTPPTLTWGWGAGVCAHVCELTHTWGTGRKPGAMEGV